MIKYLFPLLVILLVLSSHPVKAQLSFEEFDHIQNLSSPKNLVAADLDNDGYKDLAYSRENEHIISIVFNNGNETFTLPLEVQLNDQKNSGNAPYERAITFGDYNEDGFIDLALTNNYFTDSAGITILFFKGNRMVDTLVSFSSGGVSSYDILSSDFDKDGHLDLSVAHIDGTVSSLKGNGEGDFQVLHQYTFIHEPRSISLGDLNNDEWQDLIVVLPYASQIAILTGNGDGSFTQKSILSVNENPGEVYAADLDLNGIKDLVIIHPYQQLVVYPGLGDGSFGAAIQMEVPENYQIGKIAALSDIDEDGRIDIICNASWGGNKIIVFENRASFSFPATLYPAKDSGIPNSFIVEDLNRDGSPDIAYSSAVSKSINIHNGGGSTPFAAQHHIITGLSPWAVEAGDFNNDSWVDLILGNPTSNSVSIFLNESGRLREHKSVGISNHPRKISLADMNKDGNLDIVAVGDGSNDYFNNRSVLFGDGNGNFSDPKLFSFNSSSTLAINDYNNDGYLDFATIDGVYLNNGEGSFNFVYRLFVNYSHGAISNDFNKDGNADLAFTDLMENMLKVFFGNGDGSFTLNAEYSTGKEPFGLEMADLNNDGIADLVCTNRVDGTVSIFEGIEGGGFSTAKFFELLYINSSDLKIHDLDMDKILDIAVSNWDKGEVQIYKGDDEGKFTFALTLDVKGTPNQLEIADFNKDNKPDIVTANPNGKNAGFYLNNSVIEPTTPPAGLTFSEIKSTKATVRWEQEQGSGSSSIILIKEGENLSSKPEDGTFYAQNNIIGSGTRLSDSSYVVYAGQDTSVTIEGLKEDTNYRISLYSYTVNSQNTIINYLTSTYTDSLFHTLKIQSIFVPPLSEPSISDSVITINASSSSGLAINYEVKSGPAEIKDNKILLKEVGYVEILMEQAGNEEFDSADSVIAFCIKPVQPTISVITSDSSSFNLVASIKGNLRWLYNGEILQNELTESIIVTKTGSYSVGHFVNGCYSESETVHLFVNGVEDLWGDNNLVTVAPNPIKDNLYLQFSPEVVVKKIQVYSSQGILLKEQKSHSQVFKMHEFPEGLYYIVAETNKGRLLKRFTKI